MEIRKAYVYVIFRPDGRPCYVGKGSGDRWLIHHRLGIRHWNGHLAAIFRKAEEEKQELPIVKIKEFLTDKEAFDAEVSLIAAIGRGRSGPLTNLTAGGDGAKDISQETKDKISKKLTGIPLSEETKAKISERHKKNEKVLRHIEDLASKSRGRALSPAHIEKSRIARIGKKRSLEACARMSEAQKKREHKPMTEEALQRRRATVSRNNKPYSDERREKIRIAAIAQHARRREQLKSVKVA